MSEVNQIYTLLAALFFLIVGFLFTLRWILGKDIWNEVVGKFIYDFLKWLFLLPFKILGGLIRIFTGRR